MIYLRALLPTCYTARAAGIDSGLEVLAMACDEHLFPAGSPCAGQLHGASQVSPTRGGTSICREELGLERAEAMAVTSCCQCRCAAFLPVVTPVSTENPCEELGGREALSPEAEKRISRLAAHLT